SGVLRHPHYDGKVKRAHGYRLAVGNAEAIFLSASPTAHVAGATASLLLEIDEGQDVDFDKYTRDFRPMAAAANATTVIYGTAWTPDTVVERQRQTNEARTAAEKDGFGVANRKPISVRALYLSVIVWVPENSG
ncbi:MAG: hypothetical protein EBU40_12520, partial [Proteobacteria bacterium]|nr:hypothetical protein [Pseudomonadota bacterium]